MNLKEELVYKKKYTMFDVFFVVLMMFAIDEVKNSYFPPEMASTVDAWILFFFILFSWFVTSTLIIRFKEKNSSIKHEEVGR